MPVLAYHPLGVRDDGRPVVPPVTFDELAAMARRDEETPLPGATTQARRLVNNILEWLEKNTLDGFGYASREVLMQPGAPGVGWGVVYHHATPPAVRHEVDRLVEHRGGYPLEDWAEGETLTSWLERHGVNALNRDVTSKLPYYLLVVGSPAAISFADGFELSRLRAVGRLDLGDDPRPYRTYIDSLLATEARPVARPRVLLAAAPAFTGQAGSHFTAHTLIQSLAKLTGGRQEFETLLLELAECAELKAVLQSDAGGWSPVLACLAFPGLAFPINHPQQPEVQGAWVGAEWQGGMVPDEAILDAEQVGRDFHAAGSLLLSMAAYGAGTPQKCEYARVYNAFHPLQKTEEDLARRPFSAALPRRLLGYRRNGNSAAALAFAGHAGISWLPAFDESAPGEPIYSLYEEFVRCLLRGETIGMAAQAITSAVQACNKGLSEYKDKLGRLKTEYPDMTGRLWLVREHARSFVLFGDPAVRLRSPKGDH